MKTEDEREHFAHWISTAVPFDSNVGMVEHSIKTDAAWLGWMARAASEAFTDALRKDEYTHPKLPLLPPSTELEKMVEAAGMVNVLNHGSGSCVYSEGCHGVTQEHLERFAELVRAAERQRCIALCMAERLTYEVGTNAETAYGEGVEGCIRAIGGPTLIQRDFGA